MTFLRRARFGLSVALLVLLGAMFMATMATAHDLQPSNASAADMAMGSDDGPCRDRLDQDCQWVCRVFCHGLVIDAPGPAGPLTTEPARYQTLIVPRVGFGSEIEDPPPRS